MPGSRGENLRGGDLAEGLGLEVLRHHAFIAPVPRPDDVGFDAVATLFRREKRRLIAEDSFLVQVKAASVREIRYDGEQLDWLRALKFPFFWLSVDLKNSTFELWSLIHATGHLNFRDRKSITLYLDECKFGLVDDEMHVWLEKPILRWTSSDSVTESFQQTAYEVLNAWIAFEMRCLAVRPLGMTLPVRWETNSMPQPTGAYGLLPHPSELKPKLEQMLPYIQTLSMLSIESDESSKKLFVGLLLISDYMRQNGVDPDPNGYLQTLAYMRIKEGISPVTNGTGTT